MKTVKPGTALAQPSVSWLLSPQTPGPSDPQPGHPQENHIMREEGQNGEVQTQRSLHMHHTSLSAVLLSLSSRNDLGRERNEWGGSCLSDF